jgi:hypothetical protein
MSDTQRPWGDRSAASGVESLYQWALDEIKALHARIDRLLDGPEPVPTPPMEEPDEASQAESQTEEPAARPDPVVGEQGSELHEGGDAETSGDGEQQAAADEPSEVNQT